MTFLKALADTYDYCLENELVDNHTGDGNVLLPIYHDSKDSDGKNIILCRLNPDSTLHEFKFLPKGQTIIFPVTESSASRTSGVSAHPLTDKVGYIFNHDLIKNNQLKTENHRELLTQWMNYSNGDIHKFLSIIYTFLNNNEIQSIVDFINQQGPENQYTIESFFKDNNMSQMFITFEVINFNGNINKNVTTYKELHQNYIQFVNDQPNEKIICNISGKEDIKTNKHRNDQAKIIISNEKKDDHVNWSGRFQNSQQVSNVGRKTSEKAHLMLKYLRLNKNASINIGNSGYMISWFSNDINQPAYLMVDEGINEDIIEDDIDMFEDENDDTAIKQTKHPVDYQSKIINQSLFFGERKFDPQAKFYSIVVQKASDGRQSIKHFMEIPVGQLTERLEQWYEKYHWVGYSPKMKMYMESIPSMFNIIDYAYCPEDKGKLRTSDASYKKFKHLLVNKMIIALFTGGKIPKEITKRYQQIIKERHRYNKCWNSVLFHAQAVLSNEREDKYTPMLDKENTNRSYLYGRLLAVYHLMEKSTRSKDQKNSTQTNAERFWSAYTNRPASTRNILEEKIKRGYESRLMSKNEGLYIKLKKYETEINDLLTEHYNQNNDINKPLTYDFMFGYTAQLRDFYTKTTKEEEK